MSRSDIRFKVSGKFGALLQAFLARCGADVAKARVALRAGDLAAVGDTGHRLRGSGGFYGQEEISSLGGRIESAARAGDGPQTARLLEELDAYLARLRPEFE